MSVNFYGYVLTKNLVNGAGEIDGWFLMLFCFELAVEMDGMRPAYGERVGKDLLVIGQAHLFAVEDGAARPAQGEGASFVAHEFGGFDKGVDADAHVFEGFDDLWPETAEGVEGCGVVCICGGDWRCAFICCAVAVVGWRFTGVRGLWSLGGLRLCSRCAAGSWKMGACLWRALRWTFASKEQRHFHEGEFEHELTVRSDAHIALGFGGFGEKLFKLAQAETGGLLTQGFARRAAVGGGADAHEQEIAQIGEQAVHECAAVAAAVEKILELLHECCGVAALERSDEGVQRVVVESADHLRDGVAVDLIAGKGDRLIEQADGVAHAAGGIFGDQRERFVVGVDAFAVTDLAQMRGEHGRRDAVKIEALGA